MIDGTTRAPTTSIRMRPLIILLAATAVLHAEERLAATAKNDVELAIYACDDGKNARATAKNRNDYAVDVDFTCSFSISGEPQHFHILVPPKGEAGGEGTFPIDGSTIQAEVRIQAVEKAPISVASGYTVLAESSKDGVQVHVYTHASAPDRCYLVFDNRTDHAVQISWLWHLDRQPTVERLRIAARSSEGANGEILRRIRAPDDDREATSRAVEIVSVLPDR
jgi:hypothetical protein